MRWYPVTLLFLAFDVEILLMYPWAVVVTEVGAGVVLEMFLFLGALFVAVFWAWREGALDGCEDRPGAAGGPARLRSLGALEVTAALGGLGWLTVVLFANTLISLVYHLRWIAPVYGSGKTAGPSACGGPAPKRWSAATAVVAAVLTLLLGSGPGLL